eukprot:209905-Amphidinium_carterae.1
MARVAATTETRLLGAKLGLLSSELHRGCSTSPQIMWCKLAITWALVLQAWRVLRGEVAQTDLASPLRT